MRSVACKVTGERGVINEFYHAPDGKYYKSKEIYNEKKEETEYRQKIFKIINEELLRKIFQILKFLHYLCLKLAQLIKKS